MSRALVLLGLLAGIQAAYIPAPLLNADSPNVIPGEYLVEMKSGTAELKASTLSEDVQVFKIFQINDWKCYYLKAGTEGLRALRLDPNVKYVEANCQSAELDCQEQATNSTIWGLTRTSAREMPSYPGGNYYFLEEENGSGVEAYVVDTGIYVLHNDFGGRAKHGMTASNISEGDDDLNSHGTHVAGTIGGTQYGVAKNVNLVAVKVLNSGGSGTAAGIVEGINWIVVQHQSQPNKKSVMNMSLGISPPSTILEDAVYAAIAAGVNAAVSARNNNRDACVDSPSRIREAITCAASDNADVIASFSNYGECVDIIAPGVNVLSSTIGNPDASGTKSGTSMSAPHAAGWVARYLSSFPEDVVPTPAEVQEAMKETATLDQIRLDAPKDTTPNQLLYAACD